MTCRREQTNEIGRDMIQLTPCVMMVDLELMVFVVWESSTESPVAAAEWND